MGGVGSLVGNKSKKFCAVTAAARAARVPSKGFMPLLSWENAKKKKNEALLREEIIKLRKK